MVNTPLHHAIITSKIFITKTFTAQRPDRNSFGRDSQRIEHEKRGHLLMKLPDYWLKRPSMTSDESAKTAFTELLMAALSADGCTTIEVPPPWPKWQFLCHIADNYDIAFHGSGNPDIAIFEPRKADDLLSAFGNQKAVYAASDGIWPIFYAIVDRDKFAMSINNACIQLEDAQGTLHEPHYVFSVDQSFLARQPWRTGVVYLLPRTTFTPQTPTQLGATTVHIAQLASLEPVRPLAKLTVTPGDFPFLAQIRGHDDSRFQDYAAALQTGAPWPKDV